MARTKNETETVTEISEAAAATRAEIANRPRQSQVRLVEYFAIVREAAPEKLTELFGDQVEVLEENVDRVENPLLAAIQKATDAQVSIAVKALGNDDKQNGYAGFRFDQEAFDAKLAPKKTRVRKTVAEKTEDLLESASTEDLEALAAMLRAKGLSI